MENTSRACLEAGESVKVMIACLLYLPALLGASDVTVEGFQSVAHSSAHRLFRFVLGLPYTVISGPDPVCGCLLLLSHCDSLFVLLLLFTQPASLHQPSYVCLVRSKASQGACRGLGVPRGKPSMDMQQQADATAGQQYQLLSKAYLDYKGASRRCADVPGCHFASLPASSPTHPTLTSSLLFCCSALLFFLSVCASSPGSVNSKCQLASLTDKLQKEGIYG